MHIDVYPPLTLTKKGRRTLNEDFVFTPAPHHSSAESPLVFLVCDGVGGEAKGEVASEMVGSMVGKALSQQDPSTRSKISAAVALAEQAMRLYTLENNEATGMATTLTLLVFDEDGATIAHMGDSRVYQFREGKILHKTKDHSFVQELINNELISEEQAKEHPRKNVITRAVMQAPNPAEPELMNIVDLRPGDIFFLCSDGIMEAFSDAELTTIISSPEIDDEDRILMIDKRCAQVSKDNYTACLVRIKSITYLNAPEFNKKNLSFTESLKTLAKKLNLTK